MTFPKNKIHVVSSFTVSMGDHADEPSVEHIDHILPKADIALVSIRSKKNISDDDETPLHTPSALTPSDILFLPRAGASTDGSGGCAQRGLILEKTLTVADCIKLYPKSIAWSCLLFLTVVMEGYDKCLISGLYALPQFQKRFGVLRVTDTNEEIYEIPPFWQMGLLNAAVGCEIIGLLAHGYLTDKIGYKRMMQLCLVWMILVIFPVVFASSLWMLMIGQACLGERI